MATGSRLAMAVRFTGPINKQSATGTVPSGAWADEVVLAANQAGQYLYILNTGQSDLAINFGAAAGSAGAPAADAIMLNPGDEFPMRSPGPVFSDAIHMAAADADHPFLCWYA